MTTFNPDFLQKEQERLAKDGLYDPRYETSACGVGLIAAINGLPSRHIVSYGIEALKVLWHRGAVDADGKTGDGAGIHTQIPKNLFVDLIEHIGGQTEGGKIAVGQIFLPRFDIAHQERCRQVVENEVLRSGLHIHGWRQVPIRNEMIGRKAESTRPEIEQILLEDRTQLSGSELETKLYVTRRRIEKQIIADNINDFYICSLSARSIIYKGLFLAEQLSSFYPDLEDERFISNFAIYHQRFSTNTFPSWKLAQPFRVLAHNGEINTLNGNLNWLRIHEKEISTPKFGTIADDICPVATIGDSDSAALDASFELHLRSGYELPTTKNTLMPQASEQQQLEEAQKNFYTYASAMMEPWDGPAAICGYGGKWALAGLDRNGLRPLRYSIHKDQTIIIGSEAGMIPVHPSKIVEHGRIGPGGMIGINLAEGKLYKDEELKSMIANEKDYHDAIGHIIALPKSCEKKSPLISEEDGERLAQLQISTGWSMEDVELLLHVMAMTGKEATGSMGDDSPLAVLSSHYHGLHHYFRQNFSQVTNPAVDSLRERYVMSLTTMIGCTKKTDSEETALKKILKLDSPVLDHQKFSDLVDYLKKDQRIIFVDTSFVKGAVSLEDALSSLLQDAVEQIEKGADVICLMQTNLTKERMFIPAILATSALHQHLTNQNLRNLVSIVVVTTEVIDVHALAVLMGVGATAVYPYLAEFTIAQRHRKGLIPAISLEKAIENYVTSLKDGLLKIMAKSGISVLSSYRGGCNFEAIGLSRSLVARFFPKIPSRISGIGLKGIEAKISEQHDKAFSEEKPHLPIGGFYRLRKMSGEDHAWDADAIHMLHRALDSESFTTFKAFSHRNRGKKPMHLRDLLDFKSSSQSVDIREVESLGNIRKRLITPGVSLGALSKPAHEVLAIAMNRIGSKSDSGEGGEDPARYHLRSNGDNANSAIKQVASGRFGVTAEYLNNCKEIEIKVAQGAKPGEGGQLPGIKVSSMIAKLRHSTEGITLISPPPHHDIYSIEDLAQLIYDLKQINPHAEICVKLVSRAGIGAIAAGVVKAHADVILVSGHSGGTGASPQSSIKYAGIPWEMGLAEVHQVLCLNGLRERVKLRTDGGLQTGRDVVIAAILGAEEFGIGTASLVAMGCLMVRQCHSNTCPVGICTQNEKLIEKFTGTPEKVISLFSFIAQEVQEILAQLGFRTLNEIVGRTDLIEQVNQGAAYLDQLDLNPLLVKAHTPISDGGEKRYCTRTERNPVGDTLDATILKDAAPLFENGQKMHLQYNIRNTDRTVGTRVSSHMITKCKNLTAQHLAVRLVGTAGQSLGAFATYGLRLKVIGDANDYVGKGLSGGMIVITPPPSFEKDTAQNTIAGNTILYGATSGSLFAAGTVGERFAVRNSGAFAVVEGCGDNGCEYMTGGRVAILGSVGQNFAAGMTGGTAFVYDPDKKLSQNLNDEFVQVYTLKDNTAHAQSYHDLVCEHWKETGSAHAKYLLDHWMRTLENSWHIVPIEIAKSLDDLPQAIDLSLMCA